ncbi:hypothetical protein [Streptomyces sp. NPDC048436]|uniref:hypothetical protein n=1 Tax=Streptomyces sp. NPDC048436 TaxID=3365550 RepID=UPI0037131BF0
MPPASVHFNGGVNLPDAPTVLRALAERVPAGVRRLPDGETGDRAQWIGYQFPRLLATPGLVPDTGSTGDTAADDSYEGGPSVRLAEGTDPEGLRWPDLGYASEYEKSYAAFVALRDEGVVPGGVRMQAEYPTPLAVGSLFSPGDKERIAPSYERALLGDLDRLLALVPHADLAVQWDLAVETVLIDQDPSRLEPLTSRVAALMGRVPDGVPVGVHLCYGDFEHRHMIEPESLANQVEIANALAGGPAGPRPGSPSPSRRTAPTRRTSNHWPACGPAPRPSSVCRSCPTTPPGRPRAPFRSRSSSSTGSSPGTTRPGGSAPSAGWRAPSARTCRS